MSPYKTEKPHTAVETAPLFASVWLALFDELRKNYLAQKAAGLKAKTSKDSEFRL